MMTFGVLFAKHVFKIENPLIGNVGFVGIGLLT